MKRNIFFLLLTTIGLWACGSGNEKNNSGQDSIVVQEQVTDNATDAAVNEQSATVAGTYKGILPCADCEGIETVVALKADGNYTRTITYLGKKTDNVFSGSGKWSWINEFTISLGSSSEAPARYDVAENKLVQLDMAGNRITGELASKYELKKQ